MDLKGSDKALAAEKMAAANSSVNKEAFTYKMLGKLAEFSFHFPRLIIIVGLISCLLGMAYTAKYLTFDADQANLIKRSAGLQAEQDRYTNDFPRSEDIVVIVEDGTAAQRRAFIDDLASRLREEPDIFKDVFEKADVTFLRNYALHYLEPQQLREIAQQLKDYGPGLEALASSGSLANLMQKAPQLSAETGNSGLSNPNKLKGILPTAERFLDLFTQSMETRGRGKFVSPWTDIMLEQLGQEGGENEDAISSMFSQDRILQYNTIANGRFYALLCRPVYRSNEGQDVSINRAVSRIREILEVLERSHTNVLVGLTGELVLNVDEADSSTADSTQSAILSLVLIAIIFIWAFREIFKPLMAVLGLIVGIGWTMAFTTLAIGHLNLLTVTFATILMGLGIDFGIHFLYRYDEERAKTADILAAMQATMRGAGYENLTGAVSTALAFYVLSFTDFTGIAELGIIAGSGILLCYLSMMLILPSLIFLTEDKNKVYEAKGISRFAFFG